LAVVVKLNDDLRQPAIKEVGQEVRANLARDIFRVQGSYEFVPVCEGLVIRDGQTRAFKFGLVV
jgi:hypothetical protein